ncbi:hypothetical protein [Bacillus toyonensis]|jgi:hypothetical protein|uniref:hypothetical protein n=1 Tax=Bacillus toyonensis TaxID=155322 RepID=UPI000BF37604|nr:hypothetical protein [Bacillus toyonensis]PFY49065.1 hypothetical protein COL55_13235 [Bacillus toyonensis]PFY86034.1 hypothetical protein COL62_02230 [Bacillus toyonensis]
MRAFNEVVNDITNDGYCVELDEHRLKQVFEALSHQTRWNGTYHGWQENSVWNEVCETVHQYMKDKEW